MGTRVVCGIPHIETKIPVNDHNAKERALTDIMEPHPSFVQRVRGKSEYVLVSCSAKRMKRHV